ncbi:hypothetical protein ABI125_07090 [Tamlana crocina]
MKNKLQVVLLSLFVLSVIVSCQNCCKADLEIIKKQNKEILNAIKKIGNPSEESGSYVINNTINYTESEICKGTNLGSMDFKPVITAEFNADRTRVLNYTITFIAYGCKIESIVLKTYTIKNNRKNTKNIMKYKVKFDDSKSSYLVSFKLDSTHFDSNAEAKKAFQTFLSRENGEEVLRVKFNPKENRSDDSSGVEDMGTERSGIATTTNEAPNTPDKM